jgi:hypothetical protein
MLEGCFRGRRGSLTSPRVMWILMIEGVTRVTPGPHRMSIPGTCLPGHMNGEVQGLQKSRTL